VPPVAARVVVAVPAQQERGDDARGGHGCGDVVDPFDGVVAGGFEPELHDGVGRVHLGV